MEVDQGGKIEQTWMETIIAFSNKYQYAILIPQEVKREILENHREKQIILKMFIIGVYYCIKDYIKDELIVIDDEYEGKSNYIKSKLLEFIRRDHPDFDKKLLRTGNVGKNSNAHKLARDVRKGFTKPQKILTKNDILKNVE